MTTVYYHRASPMAPNHDVSRHGHLFRCVKNMYVVPLEHEADFLSISCIEEAVNASRMWRAGPYYQASDPPPEEPVALIDEVSAPDTEPKSTRRGRKRDVQVTDGLDTGDTQPRRSDSGSERNIAGGVQSATGATPDVQPGESLETEEL